MHLIVDGYATNMDLLTNEAALKAWVLRTPEVIGMHPYGSPIVVDFPFPGRDTPALSAVQFLGESSITVHTYPDFRFVFLDIFSCLDFSEDKALKFVVDSFGLTKYLSHVINRGIDSNGKPILEG